MSVNLNISSPTTSCSISSSTNSPAAPAAPNDRDTRIAGIRDRVLLTIRQHVPIATLFTPELKIDLGVFIKDQILFRKIAEFLASLDETGQVTSDWVAKQFGNSELQNEISVLFKQDQPLYLALFYEACADVLNKKPVVNKLKTALEGRIFTLKNALVGQNNPEAIRSNQVQNGLTPQEISSIKEEAESFLRESIRMHLEALKIAENSAFRALLASTAEQLIPFVQKITQIYLVENGKNCPDNPLTFRNPTGYNYHGLTASTIMETCLHALGYRTRLMGRCDLDPKVTLAPANNLVEVTAPDNTRYIIDPCHMQFHKDICSNDSDLPTSPLLVLAENEVDDYVEQLMIHWKANAERVKKEDTTLIKELTQRDQIIPFIIQRYPLPEAAKPSDPETWVRTSLKRIWGLRNCYQILCNRGFQEIFLGNAKAHKTYDYIKTMGLGVLSQHLSNEEAQRRLDALLRDPKLKGQNSLEALSLIAQLPPEKNHYSSLLDVDPRIDAENGGIGDVLNAYFRSLKKVVNPEGKNKSVIYGCSGADCSSVMLATDAQDFTFVDLTPTSFNEFEQALSSLKDLDPLSDMLIRAQLEESNQYISTRKRWGGSSSKLFNNGKQKMQDLAVKLLYDLRTLGVDLEKVVLRPIPDGTGVCIEFPWQYHGAASARNRRVTYLTGDITQPATYPAALKAKLKEGFDIFYLKAAFLAPRYYPQFLPLIAQSVRQEGWLMTTDKTFTMDEVNPEECLKQNGLPFVRQNSDETRVLEQLMIPSFDPLSNMHQLQNSIRWQRPTGSDLTYWTQLNLRQKS